MRDAPMMNQKLRARPSPVARERFGQVWHVRGDRSDQASSRDVAVGDGSTQRGADESMGEVVHSYTMRDDLAARPAIIRTSMTAGIRSRVTADLIQFDGMTTGGSSGSPVFNADGDVTSVRLANSANSRR